MECAFSRCMVLYDNEFIPVAYAEFLEGGEMLEEFMAILYRFTLLSD